MGFTYEKQKRCEKKISDELKILYDNNKVSTKEELEKNLDPKNFNLKDFDLKYYIEKMDNYDELRNYFFIEKQKHLINFMQSKLNEKERENKYEIYFMQSKLNEEKKNELKQKKDEIIQQKEEINNLNTIINENKKLIFLRNCELSDKLNKNEKLKKDLKNKEEELRKVSESQRREIKRREKKNNDIILKYEQEKSEMEKQLKKNSDDMKRKIEEEKKKIKEESEKKIKELEMNYQKELNKIKRLNIFREKRKLMELKTRKDKLNTDFEQEIEKIKERKIKQILEQHKQSENNFGIGDISKYWEKTISSFIKNLFESEQIISIVLYHLKLFVNEFKKKF